MLIETIALRAYVDYVDGNAFVAPDQIDAFIKLRDLTASALLKELEATEWKSLIF